MEGSFRKLHRIIFDFDLRKLTKYDIFCMKEIYPRNNFFGKRRESNFKSRRDLSGRKDGLQVLRRRFEIENCTELFCSGCVLEFVKSEF